ncbi:Cytochrome P450 4V2 [Cytospora mali]|uniref:Cytochrome P450 4V2 n=1 Tax=Cytospora mali TaxID=578113 RepID=A0A194VCD3_CYTMA|nr:Cytochrome P450 4V2 [Valsa mali var. pyri (nom. inval.)]
MAPFIVFGVILLGLYSLYRWLLPKPYPGIPFNPESAKNLFGDIPSLVKDVSKTGDMAGWVHKQAERARSPVTQIFLKPFGRPTLLICDFREAQDVLLHRSKEFDRSGFLRELFYGTGGDHHITMKTGPEWKGRRRLLQDLMSPGFLNDVAAPSIYASSLNVLRLWELKADMADGRPFSASKDIFCVALDAVLAFAIGTDFKENATRAQIQLLQGLSAEQLVKTGSEDDPVEFPVAPMGEAISGLLTLTGTVERVRSAPSLRLRWWFLMREKVFKDAWKAKEDCIHEELDKAVQARKQHQGKGDAWVRSAVAHMVDRETHLAEKEGRQPDYHSTAMVTEVFGFIVAGHDTTSTTLCWGVKFLADHPEVQNRLRNDLQTAFSAARGERRLPTVEEITRTSVPYLEATMEEILRMGNTVPIVDREALQDTTLLGHHVPKGTQILFLSTGPSLLTPAFDIDDSKRSPQARQSKTRAWSDEDIGLFKPERWLAEDNGVEVFDSQAGPAMPFSLGIRGCFGRRLAYLELRLLLTVIMWSFELLKCPEELSGYEAVDGVVHGPKKCFVRLRKVAY